MPGSPSDGGALERARRYSGTMQVPTLSDPIVKPRVATSWVHPLVAHRSNFVCASQLAQKLTYLPGGEGRGQSQEALLRSALRSSRPYAADLRAAAHPPHTAYFVLLHSSYVTPRSSFFALHTSFFILRASHFILRSSYFTLRSSFFVLHASVAKGFRISYVLIYY